MDPLARRNREILEAIESCRADSGDLNDPQFADLAAVLDEDDELRARFKRIRQADVAIKAAFSDVPVPADLAGNVLRRLNEAAASELDQPIQAIRSATESALDSPAPPAQPVAPRQKLITRRRLVAGIATVAAATALGAAIWIHNSRSAALTSGQVLETAMDFFGRDNSPRGEPVSRVAPPSGFPISPEIVAFADIRWRRVDDFMNGGAVAYDLPPRVGKATLYVFNCTVTGLPQYPPLEPAVSTGGNSAAAWQSGGLVYVLVVQGDAQTYAKYLQPQGPTV
jgi:hypothetical protein